MSDIWTVIEALAKHPVQRRGRKVLCPFHDDHVMSGSVNDEQDLYYCHACGIGGNPVTLIEEVENVDRAHAFERKASILGEDRSGRGGQPGFRGRLPAGARSLPSGSATLPFGSRRGRR